MMACTKSGVWTCSTRRSDERSPLLSQPQRSRRTSFCPLCKSPVDERRFELTTVFWNLEDADKPFKFLKNIENNQENGEVRGVELQIEGNAVVGDGGRQERLGRDQPDIENGDG